MLGVLYGDGYLAKEYSYHYDLELIVKDYEFAEEFSRAVAEVLGKKFKSPRRLLRRPDIWRVRYYSKAFHTWFKRQTLDTLKPYIEYNMDTVKHFLRGLYDSEGYNYKCRRILLYNSDQELLKYTQYLLKRYFNIKAIRPYLYIRAGSIHRMKNGREFKTNHNCYHTAIYRKGDVQRFLSEIGFSIKEKQLGLKRRA